MTEEDRKFEEMVEGIRRRSKNVFREMLKSWERQPSNLVVERVKGSDKASDADASVHEITQWLFDRRKENGGSADGSCLGR
jgi:hypothetical protein